MLQALMVLDVSSTSSEESSSDGSNQSDESDDDDSSEDELKLGIDHDRESMALREGGGGGSRNSSNKKIQAPGLAKLHISHLLQMVLQDAQTRLFFKAQSVVQSMVRYYVPKAEDLDYPGKLRGGGRSESFV